MASPAQTSTTIPIRGLRTTFLAIMGSLLALGVWLWFDIRAVGAPPTWAVVLLLGLAALAWALGATWGFSVPALDPGTPAKESAAVSRLAFQTSSLRRLYLGDVVAIVGVVLAVALSSFVTYAVAALLALAVIMVNAWPTDRSIAKVQARLDAGGAQSYLRDHLYGQEPGTSSPPGAVIRWPMTR